MRKEIIIGTILAFCAAIFTVFAEDVNDIRKTPEITRDNAQSIEQLAETIEKKMEKDEEYKALMREYIIQAEGRMSRLEGTIDGISD